MKVLILCNDFPPLNSIGAERPYSWFKYLKRSEIEPVVITKNWIGTVKTPLDVLNNVKPEIEKTVTEEGTILRVPHGHILPEKIFMKYGEFRFSRLRKACTFIYKYASFHSTFFDQHVHIYRVARQFLKSNKVDIIIATGEPNILFRYGYLLKKEFNIKWVADYRDGWYLDHVTSKDQRLLSKLSRKHELRLENKYMRSADLITSVDPNLTGALGEMHKRPTACIYNGFWDFKDSMSNRTHENTDKLILTHTGTLTPGQRVEFLLEAIVQLVNEGHINNRDLEIRFIGLAYFPQQLKRVEEYSKIISEFIVITDRVTQEEALEYNFASDYLINFTEADLKAIYGKTYTYIACRKPIMVIPNDESILGELVVNYKLGYTFNKIDDLKKHIKEVIQQKKDGKFQTRLNKNEGLNFFLRKNQTSLLAEALESVITK